MNSEIISGKLLIISVFLSLTILLFSFIQYFSLETTLLICNSENKITSVIRNSNFDIVIDSGSRAQTVECLGRLIPFYDRKIDVLITDDENIPKEISSYYEIEKVATSREYKINSSILISNDKNLIVKNINNLYYIAKRPISYMFKITRENGKEITLFRPPSDEKKELQIKKIPYNQKEVLSGKVITIPL